MIGGRLDYLDNHSEQRWFTKDASISLICLFGQQHWQIAMQTMMAREGYHLVHWADGDFTYWAVSDVNADDLKTFKQQFETRTPIANDISGRY